MNAKQKRLISQGAALTEQIKALEAELKLVKTQLEATLTEGRYTLTGAELLITSSERSTLDSKLVKGFLTPAQIVQATRTSTVTSWKFRSLPIAVAA